MHGCKNDGGNESGSGLVARVNGCACVWTDKDGNHERWMVYARMRGQDKDQIVKKILTLSRDKRRTEVRLG